MRKVTIYTPGISFPSVSVTGTSCSMSCAHCSGRYLKGMADVSLPGALLDFGRELSNRGGRGLLISGGCDQTGAVDFPDHTFDEIKELKEKTGLLINLHCGLVDEETAIKISGSGVDKVSFDLVYDDDTIHEVLGLDRTRKDYLETMIRLEKHGIAVVPHILAGLYRGQLSWEFEAVEILSTMNVDEVVLIILIPTKGTSFENVPVPGTEKILELAKAMRGSLKKRIVLGCMRPKGILELEKKVLEIGFDGIVLPGRSTIKWMLDQGWHLEQENICCCM